MDSTQQPPTLEEPMRTRIPLAAVAAALTISATAAIAVASPWTTDDINQELTTNDVAEPIEAPVNDPAEESPGDGPTLTTRTPGSDGVQHDDTRAVSAPEQGHGAHDVTSELDFLTHMIPHHEEAVVAAEQLRDGTEREEMRRFAAQIIEVQTNEIEQMQTWLDAWYPGEDHTADYQPMMRDLTGLDPDEIDRAFLEDMIPHHMGAVMMAQQLLTRDLAVNPDIEPFARKIADDQRTEIMQMRRWLAEWYDASPMGGGPGHGANTSLDAGVMHDDRSSRNADGVHDPDGHVERGAGEEVMGDQPRSRQQTGDADPLTPGTNSMERHGDMDDSRSSSRPQG